jgi:hypothetical protein
MRYRPGFLPAFAVAVLLLSILVGPTWAIDVAPHRAVYKMSLSAAKASSGVTAADGSMAYEWGETCDGWTIEQRYKLRMHYAEDSEVEMVSNFVSWESKDGLRYRFDERKLKNGELDEEIRGEARLDGAGKPGKAVFSHPDQKSFDLDAGTLFPTAHTLMLIERAQAGDRFVSAKVFDGAEVEGPVDVTAVISPPLQPGAGNEDKVENKILDHTSWHMRLAFFPADASADQPDYELGERLYDNGVSRDMILDYSDFAIRAKLEKIEAVSKPSC